MNPVKKIRTNMLLTQAEFAKIIGVSRAMINAYEAGRNEPGYDKIKLLVALAKKHHIKIEIEDFFKSE